MILKDEVGEFCTARSHPIMPRLKQTAEGAIAAQKVMDVDMRGVKLMSVSFLDEWLGDLAARLGVEQTLKWIRFSPPLAAEYLQQLDRSATLRKRP